MNLERTLMQTPTELWTRDLFDQIPTVHETADYNEPGVKALFYDTLDWQGKPTRSFAWLGMPALKPGQTCPGIVLVHGGGGTAFDYWVRLWNSRGYAAIAMDTCGSLPYGYDENNQRLRHEHGGPAGWGCFAKALDDPKEQWGYHAVADVILAHNLLRSQPGVDANRIGITGISWGGYLTCLSAGVDPRYAFAMPVYGCGFLHKTSCWQMNDFPKLEKNVTDRWIELWEPSHYLPHVNCPVCWVTGTNDFAFHMTPLQLSYRSPKTPRTLCIRIEMPHGHGGLGENPKELHAFADSIVNHTQPLAFVTGTGIDDQTLWATYDSARPIMKAQLCFTRATGYEPDQKYNTIDATIDRSAGRVSCVLQNGTTRCFLNLFDDRDCVVSSEHITLS